MANVLKKIKSFDH